MGNSYKEIHSPCEEIRTRIHVVLVRPEYPGNVGSVARAVQNMGILGELRLVADKEKFAWSEARKMAKHAAELLNRAGFYPSLQEALMPVNPQSKTLSLAASARVGSAGRPHPVRVREGVSRAVKKLLSDEVQELFLVFGPESDGLSNEEVDACDWVVTIPSHATYRSLNLSQAVLVFAHEVNENFIAPEGAFETGQPGQRDKLITHILNVAEEAGFVLPGDPFKMRPRLEEILSGLPRHIPEVKTLHGLMDQVRRSLKKGEPDIRGRYRNTVEEKSDAR